jgi:biopolymer transport protein TolR
MKRKVREEEEVGELNIVPYLDIVTNLLMFMLLSTVGIVTLGVLDVGTPRIGEPDGATAQTTTPDQPKEELNLTVAITDRGFFVAGAGGVLGDKGGKDPTAGMDTTREPTVPMKNGKYDYDGLTSQMATIKAGFPNESRVILVAEMATQYEIIVQTMDACRERMVRKGEALERVVLFPEVWLSMMR